MQLPINWQGKVCPICHFLRDIPSRNVHRRPIECPRSIVNMSMERLYASPCAGNCNVYLTCHRLRNNHMWVSHYRRLESLSLEINVKNIEDFDENWQSESLMSTYVCMQLLAPLGSAVCSQYILVHFVANERTHARTSTRVAKITPIKVTWYDAAWTYVM